MRTYAALAGLVALAGCGRLISEELPGAQGTVVSGPSNVIRLIDPGTIAGTPSPSPSATPTPAPSATPTPAPTPTPVASAPGDASQIHHIRVGFFGIQCPPSKATPRNGEGKLPVGCKGFVTATPKKSNGDDVPESAHGSEIRWSLDYGHGLVEIKTSQVSDFNRTVIANRPGDFGLCATVAGVKGCLDGTVTP